MEWVTANAANIWAIVTSVVTIASIVANMTKTDADNQAVAAIGKLVNFLAINFKK